MVAHPHAFLRGEDIESGDGLALANKETREERAEAIRITISEDTKNRSYTGWIKAKWAP